MQETSTKTDTAAAILLLESEMLALEMPDDAEIKATMFSDSVDEMQQFAASAKIHLYEPFESSFNDYKYMTYVSVFNPKIKIEIRSKQNYRQEKTIQEI